MKKILAFILAVFILSEAHAQTKDAQPKMIELFHVILTKGNNRTQDSVTAEKIQAAHIANMEKMHKEGKLLLAGPFGEDGDWRGIFILKCKDKKEAEALVKTDPAVQAGRLSYIITSWWTQENCLMK